jgi:hypothetical protein
MQEIDPNAIWNNAAEQSVIGAVLLNPELFPAASAIVQPTDFYLPAHITVWKEMLSMHAKGDDIEVVSLAHVLQKNSALKAIGGSAYLAALLETVPTSANCLTYARLVLEKSLRRAIASDALLIARDAADRNIHLLALASTARAATDRLVSGSGVVAGSTQDVEYQCMSDIIATPISWLWKYRIAKGVLTIEAGDPGLGKSQISLHHAAVVTTGGMWPDGTMYRTPGNVILITAEDDAATTIKPRLIAAGADMERVYIVHAINDVSGGKKRRRGFDLESDIVRLDGLIKQIGGADLVVVDPISAYVGKADSYKNSDVRALLAPLVELAGRHQTAVIVVSHLAKSSGSAMNSISGSLGFIASARTGYLIVKHPTRKEWRLFTSVKNNIGIDNSGFAFKIEGIVLEEQKDGKPTEKIETSKVIWDSRPDPTLADDALAAQCKTAQERSELDAAVEFLEDQLKSGPVLSSVIKSEARNAGISESTLNRAKSMLKIKPRKGPCNGPWKWDYEDQNGAEKC